MKIFLNRSFYFFFQISFIDNITSFSTMKFFNVFYYVIFIQLMQLSMMVQIDNTSDSNESTQKIVESCINRNFIIVSTMDGVITALDMNTGKKCWTVLLDAEKFLSSSLSELKIYEKGQRIWLVPSLDGTIFKYDSFKLQPLPVNVDSLLNHSPFLDTSTSITGGKIKMVFGIDRLTGEIVYTCNLEGCSSSKFPFTSNVIVFEEVINLVNAIDSTKAQKKWHFRVVELKVKLPSQILTNDNYDFPDEIQKSALVPSNFKEVINFDKYKVSLQNGFAGMLDNSAKNFSWLFKTPCPINDAWFVKDYTVKILDPFDNDSGYFSIEMDNGKHSALLFLGTFEKQLFIKKSIKFPLKTSNYSSLMVVNSISFPVCPKYAQLGTHHNPGSQDLILPNPYADFNVSEYGSYFYMNYSIAENTTHCIINTSYIIQYDNRLEVGLWFMLYIIGLLIFIILLIAVIHILYAKNNEHATASVLPEELPISDKNNFDADSEFRSRFHQDFELITVLGKGGFGIVMDVKNKIDDCRYAVKRIRLYQNFQYEKVFREVKALAKLDHPGIVRYFNAWIEYPPSEWQEKKDRELNVCDVTDSSSSSNVLYCKTASKSNKLLQKLNHNPLQPLEDPFLFDPINEMSKDYQFSDYSISSVQSNSWEKSQDSTSSSGIIGWQKPKKAVEVSKDISHEEVNYLQSSDLSTNSCVKPDLKLASISSGRNCVKDYIPKEFETCYDFLKNLNRSLMEPLQDEMFYSFCRCLFHNSTFLEECVTESLSWKEFYDLYITSKRCVISFQHWIICMICMLMSSKDMAIELVMNNYYRILWDITQKLDQHVMNELKPSRSISFQYYSDDNKINKIEAIKDSSEDAVSNQSTLSSKGDIQTKTVAPGYLYIQMQLCKKESLREWLNRNQKDRQYKKVIEIFNEIVDAVHYVHNSGLMHRDLKPSNIYFSLEGAIKIGDFGLATSSELQEAVEGKNKGCSYNHTTEIGTLFYMSPEQKQKQDYDSKTDIYSLGIILFELLVPFNTQTERYRVLTKVCKFEFPTEFLNTYQDESELVRMLLNPDPEKRPSTHEIKYHPLLLKYPVCK